VGTALDGASPDGPSPRRDVARDESLDLEHRTLTVERTLSDDGERVDTPKSDATRTVDLTNEAVRVLRAQIVRRREGKLRRGWKALPKVFFPSMAGTYTTIPLTCGGRFNPTAAGLDRTPCTTEPQERRRRDDLQAICKQPARLLSLARATPRKTKWDAQESNLRPAD
jgi:hypothetical protein